MSLERRPTRKATPTGTPRPRAPGARTRKPKAAAISPAPPDPSETHLRAVAADRVATDTVATDTVATEAGTGDTVAAETASADSADTVAAETASADALPTVVLYADGACSGNPGPGGWGAILVSPASTKRLEISGADLDTTNNRMEMTAVLQALQRLKTRSRVRVVTDSRYVIDGMKSWIHAWRRNGWRTSDNKPVKNKELWEALSEQTRRHEVAFEWVRGHKGHVENERCDEMAREAINTARKLAARPKRPGS